MKPVVVTVFGSSSPARRSAAYQTAYELGCGIAQAGWTLCNGGYGGTMEAAAKGAVEAGGHTIGVTLRNLRLAANAFIRQEVPTFSLLVRLETLVRLGSAYVVLPGGTGTLLELALVWEMFNKGLLHREAPIILLGAERWSPIVNAIRCEQPDAIELQIVDNPNEAVQCIAAGLAKPSSDAGAAT